jgi:hypothetical protein
MEGRPTDLRSVDPGVAAIGALIRAELTEQAAAGLPLLQRVPSTGAIKQLDHMATLTLAEITALMAAQARLAALHFFPAPFIARAHEELRTKDAAILALAAALRAPAFAYGLRLHPEGGIHFGEDRENTLLCRCNRTHFIPGYRANT